MKRIKKVSQTVPTYGQIVDGYSNSTTDSYSANYQNEHNIIVKSEQPTTNERVWFAKGKNLFDKNNPYTFYGYVSGSTNKLIIAGNNDKSLYIRIKPNTTYTIQKIVSSRFGVCTCGELTNNLTLTNVVVNNTGTTITITSESNDKYVVVTYMTNSDSSESAILNSVQIEESSAATTYEAYTTPSINVDGDEIYHIDNYSLNEVKTNKIWIDGKPIYRKVITYNYAEGSTTASIPTGITNLSKVVLLNPIMLRSASDFEINYYSSSSDYLRTFYRYSTNAIEVRSSAASPNTVFYITIEYTKTTD